MVWFRSPQILGVWGIPKDRMGWFYTHHQSICGFIGLLTIPTEGSENRLSALSQNLIVYHGISSFSPSTWHCSSTFPVFGGDRRHVSLVLIVSTSTRPPAGQPQRSGPGRCKDDDRLNWSPRRERLRCILYMFITIWLLQYPILNHTHMWMKQALIYDLDFYEWNTSNDKLLQVIDIIWCPIRNGKSGHWVWFIGGFATLFWWVFPWLVQWLTPQLRWSMAKNDNHVTGASTWSASKCRSPIYSGNHRGHLQSSSVYFFQWQKLIYIYIHQSVI